MLVWIDTETTGLYPRPWTDDDGDRRDPATLLEVACIVTDDNLKEVARYQAVTDEARRVNFDHVDQVVLDMHHQNGLWGESLAKGKPLHVVDEELAAFLSPYVFTEEIKVDANLTKHRKVYPQLAGSTVSFDRGFLEIYLPNAAKQLHYRNLDVTSVNELARRQWSAVHDKRPRPSASVSHRAMPDIEDSLAVCRFYATALGPITEPRIENPEHDSLFQRFEQLAVLIDRAHGAAELSNCPAVLDGLADIIQLANLIRGQVLK